MSDLDGDSKPDIVVTNRSSNTVSVFKNTSSSGTITIGSLAAKVDFTAGSDPYGVTIGDINGDGKPDIAVVNLSGNSVSILTNTSTLGTISTGSFAAHVDFTTGSSPCYVAIGDIDGDGKLDFVVTDQTSNTISVFRNIRTSSSITTSSFASKVDLITGSSPVGVAIGDLDGDGKPDIVVTNYTGNTISIFRNANSEPISIASFTPSSGIAGSAVTINGTRFGTTQETSTVKFGTTVASVTSWSDTQIIATVPTLAAGNYTISVATSGGAANSSTQFIVNPPAPTVTSFTPSSDIVGSSVTINGTNFGATQGASTVKFGTTIASITSWSDTQIIATVPTLTSGNYTIYVTAIGGTASSATQFTVGSASIVPTITSLNTYSGLIGSTVTITGTNFSPTPTNNIVWFGAVKATVTSATSTSLNVTIPTGVTYQPITVTVNGLTAYSSKPFNVTFPSSGVIIATSFATKFDLSCGTNPYEVVLGDIDGDGKPDLAVVNTGTSSFSVFRNISSSGSITSSSFAASVDFSTGGNPEGIAMGDIDGDGKLDIVVSNYGSNSFSVFRNISTSGSITSGSFASSVDFSTGSNPGCVVIGDIDWDGKPDIVVANTANTFSIFRNTSTLGSITTSSFATPINFSFGLNTFGIALGDIDGDGKLDIAFTNWTQEKKVSILRNTSTSGSISFDPKVDFTTGTNPYSVAFGDIDSDSKPDLVVANQLSSTVSVFINTSTSGSITASSFTSSIDFATGSNPRGIKFGDIDGDGKPDLIVANQFSWTVSVFRNISTTGSFTTGSLEAKVDLATGENPYGIAVGDIDGDGKPDIATANNTSNSISILRNIVPLPPPPTITSFTPTSAIVGKEVTITGTNFGSTQATSTIKFGSTIATATSWSATQIVTAVPTLTVGNYTISVTTPGGTANSSSQFTVPVCNKPTIRKKGGINILICQTPNATSYQWYLNDNAIVGAMKQFYVARKNYGNYSVQVVETSGCDGQSNAMAITTSSLVSVYPNPVEKEFNLDLEFEQVGKVTIRLVNSIGIVKRFITVNKSDETQTFPIDVGALEKGVYFIRIEVNGEEIDSQKIVIL